MNMELTEIAFVLDRSGSMGGVAAEAIAGFNGFLRKQQEAAGKARMTLVLFDDEFLTPADHVPVEEVTPLNARTYVPRNSTALLDAIGLTIDRIGERLAKTADEARPGKVIVAILTDGMENASRNYNWKQVAEKIRHQTKKYQWEFLFLGANQDAIATAAQLNIHAGNAATWQSDKVGTLSSADALSRKASALRGRAFAAPMSPAEMADVEKPMSEIVAEEDRRRRKS